MQRTMKSTKFQRLYAQRELSKMAVELFNQFEAICDVLSESKIESTEGAGRDNRRHERDGSIGPGRHDGKHGRSIRRRTRRTTQGESAMSGHYEIGDRENQAAIELHAPPGRALRCDVCGLAMPSGGQGSSSSCARCGVGVRWRQRELL